MKITEKHVLFFTGADIYSNFYQSDEGFNYDGIRFGNSEEAFMYAKAKYFGDMKMAKKILRTITPKQAKQLGRRVSNYNDSEWSKVKVGIMTDIVKAKFSEPALKEALLRDGKHRRFVEASGFDREWGIGLFMDDPNSDNPRKWLGKNLLGKVLDEVYSYYVEEEGK